MKETQVGLNGFTLKMTAVVSMLCDHLGKVFFPDCIILNIIGRLAFPLFAFVLVEGFLHTKDVKKYMLRLLIFALLSEIPYDLARTGHLFSWDSQNVFWTLLFGVFMLYLVQKTGSVGGQFVIVVAVMAAAMIARTDYSAFGIAVVFVFYFFYHRPAWKYLAFTVLMLLMGNTVQIAAIASVLPMALYNGRRGISCKYFFYAFYPCHLMILFLISAYLYPVVWQHILV